MNPGGNPSSSSTDGPRHVALVQLRLPYCVGSIAEKLDGASAGTQPLGLGRHEPSCDAPLQSATRYTHRWVAYLSPASPLDAAVWYSTVQSVTFRLDKSFSDPVRVVKEPPFCCEGLCWAEHVVEIVVRFVPDSGLSDFTLHHLVHLRQRVDAAECPIGVTAASVLAGHEPLPALVIPDVPGVPTHTERFDSFWIVHPTEQTFAFWQSTATIGWAGGGTPREKKSAGDARRNTTAAATTLGTRRIEVMLKLLDDGDDSAAEGASSSRRSTQRASRELLSCRRVVELSTNGERMLLQKRAARDGTVASLCSALQALADERSALLRELPAADHMLASHSKRVEGYLRRLERRCKRMRGEDTVDAGDVVCVDDVNSAEADPLPLPS